MKKYFNQITQEELENLFFKNGYRITNLDQIFNPDQEELEGRDSLFVLADDIQPDPMNDIVQHILRPWSMALGSYTDLNKKIFTVNDFIINEISPLDITRISDRLISLNDDYDSLMSSKFPEYRKDFKEYVEKLKSTPENEDIMEN